MAINDSHTSADNEGPIIPCEINISGGLMFSYHTLYLLNKYRYLTYNLYRLII